jgi:hypothetical protein
VLCEARGSHPGELGLPLNASFDENHGIVMESGAMAAAISRSAVFASTLI